MVYIIIFVVVIYYRVRFKLLECIDIADLTYTYSGHSFV